MALFLTTRSTIQCRTHHQKYENKYGEVKDIIRSFKQELGLTNLKNYQNLIEYVRNRPKPEVKVEAVDNKTLREPSKRRNKETLEIGIQTEPVAGLPPLFPEQDGNQTVPNQTLATVWVPFFY